jgi:hypothetical protein
VSTPLRPAERAYSLSTRAGWQEFVAAPPRPAPAAARAADPHPDPQPSRARAPGIRGAQVGLARQPRPAAHPADASRPRAPGRHRRGLPGLGKSTIAQAFAREFHQRQVSLYGPLTGGGHDRIPVIHVCLTSSTSKRSFNAMLCRFFGLPGHDRGNAEELGHRAADAVLACDVRLCADDVHFLDPARRDGRDVANHFKYLAAPSPSRSCSSASGWSAGA